MIPETSHSAGSDKISIIIPVYNAAPYLGECLESVLNQSYRNLEIIHSHPIGKEKVER